MTAPRWVGWWFRGAALYGVAALLVLVATTPPRPDAFYLYAFAGTALAFQIAFWVIGGDAVRYRPLMPAAVVEKLGFVVPMLALTPAVRGTTLVATAIDLALGIGFLIAWRTTPHA